jgi:hypothetical protein
MEEESIRIFLQVGIGFMIVKMLFETVVTAHLKMRTKKSDTELIPIEEWHALQQVVTQLRLDMVQIKTLLRESITNGKT